MAPAAAEHSIQVSYVSLGTILRPRDFFDIMLLLAPFPFFVVALFIIASSSEVNDRCSKDRPCTPSVDGDPSFCDYQIGPSAGGYCVACEGRQVNTYLSCAHLIVLLQIIYSNPLWNPTADLSLQCRRVRFGRIGR